ncbi:MAG: leucine--tRNA ligase [Candidatus Caldarchaeum sp.]|nr:leucine--tRNA ligase [Candidatus Caldarchaeum sp.]
MHQERQLLELGFKLGASNIVSSPKPYERKWVERWRKDRVFEAKPDESRQKFFICVPYSYQNGPLHLGHGFTFTRGDVIARYKRMAGYNVLFPWAWHWTGEAVAGTSERLLRGDEAVKRMLTQIDGVPENLLQYFTHPEFVCAYYTAENRHVVDAMGWSADWSREFYTTSLHPYYSNFIVWQYTALRRKGLLVQGRHPVVWCPKCQSATGDHDRLRGEGIYPEEYTMVFFELGDMKLAAATLRPETIYGTTNVWINPEGVYVVVEKNGTKLVISREALQKLSEQLPGLRQVGIVMAKEILGKFVKTPLTNDSVPVLPADFVDVSLGTGVVYSVPAHAPFDYVALKDLQKNPSKLTEEGLDPEIVKNIKPKKVIETQGLTEFPAVDAVEKLGITSQLDERLEDLTRDIYSKEFYSGIMAVGEFKGRPVSEARQLIIEKLKETSNGDVFYDLAEKVVCRSGDECVVKIVEDQWFLNFSNPDWKTKVKQHISQMNIYPEAARTWFLNVVDWLRDWACTRKTGLGTPLPWDASWKIETLSDSTVYPALYTISRMLNQNIETASRLNTEAFDYVFLGIGDKNEVAAKNGVDSSFLESMRREFLYWYGVDLRVSAKDLVPNHLTFYLFHHTGIFDERVWPRGISVNGMITIEGEKMSKSRGNFITLKQAVSKHGSDATRLALLLSAEDLDDPDWREKTATEAEQFVQNFLGIVEKVVNEASETEGPADEWLSAAADNSIETISQMLDRLKTRSACNEAVYGMLNNWRWYLRRNGGKITKAAKVFIERWALVLSPFAPFAAEEAWERMGKQGYACLQRWPRRTAEPLNLGALLYEEILKGLVSDVREVLKVVKGKPVELRMFAASKWKRDAAIYLTEIKPPYDLKALKKARPELFSKDPAVLQKIAEKLRETEQKARGLTTQDADTINVLKNLLDRENTLLQDCLSLVEQELKISARLLKEDEASEAREVSKARQSIPLKPAIYFVTEQ